jgi:heat shock protein HslJ
MSNRTATEQISVFGLLIAALIFTSCATAQQSIEGKWKISGYTFADKRNFPLDKLEVTLNVDRDIKIAGRSACNLYSGSVTLGPGNSIKLRSFTSTDMACQEIPGSFEGEFMNLLSNADRYELKGGTLTLTDTATGHFLRFERAGVPQPIVTPTPVNDPPESDKHEVFYVSNKSANCPIIAPLRCMLIKGDKTAPWKKYYDEIIGFKFKPGRFYKIEVERVGEPSGLPGDVTVYRHRLVRVIKTSKKEKDIYR